MNLYKVLLVDDEQEVIDAVIRKTPWSELGYEVVGSAQNGEEAMELAEANPPDVVMTDIKMPFMDGLTLSRKLKEIYGDIKIIIFSGFEEFEYAREAIKIEVEEYILKPIRPEELCGVFKRIRESLDRERNEKINIKKLREYYQKSLPVMQDQFFISLIEGRMADDQIESYRANYQIDMEGAGYSVTVVHMKRDEAERKPVREPEGGGAGTVPGKAPEGGDTDGEMTAELLNVSLKQFIDENLSPFYEYKSLLYFGKIIYILTFQEDDDIMSYTDRLDQILRRAGRILERSVSAGIGKVYRDLSGIKYSYDGAKNALFYKGAGGEGQTVYIDELEPVLDERFTLYDQNVQMIIQEIKLGDKEKLDREIENLMQYLKETKRSISQYQMILMEAVTELYKLAGAYKLDMNEIFGEDPDISQRIFKIESLYEIRSCLADICMKIRRSIRKERTNSAQVLIDRATDYIRRNFQDSGLSIEKICSELNVSSAYFSTLFKKVTGKTFLNYLTDIRMEMAVTLLDSTEEKTYVIAEKIGYSEPNYFSYVFKKKYGVSPSKYRKNRLEQNDSENQGMDQ